MVRTFGRNVGGPTQPVDESPVPRAARPHRPGRGRAGRVVSMAAIATLLGVVVGAGTFATASWSGVTSSASKGPMPARAFAADQVRKGPLGSPMIAAGGSSPRISGRTSTNIESLNWAGYGVSGAGGSFTTVQASFVVPSLASCGPDEDSSSSFWAGIDGLASATVEQDGVDASCSNGAAQYFAWYEIYPQMPVVFPQVTVASGDSMVASVASLGNSSYWLRLVDSTNGTSGAVVVSLPGATNSSAECIAEDPGTTPVPYTDYGTVSFTSCLVNGTAVGEHSPVAITNVSTSGSSVATPSPLQGDVAFSVARAAGGSSAASSSPSPSPGPLTTAVVGMASTPSGGGYWLADSAGGVDAHGGASYYGSMAGVQLDSPIAHIVSTSDGLGYWLVAGDGGIFSFGDAAFYGSMGGRPLNAPVVAMAPTADDRGYWLVASDGGIFSFGDAAFHGSMGGVRLNQPVVAVTEDIQTGGYWEAASDGGIFAFDAPFLGSTGSLHLNRPVVSMAATASGSGYWFVASDGGIFAFDAPFLGSGGGDAIPAPIVGMAGDQATDGYWMVAANGSVYSFGAPFYGTD